MSDSSPFAPLEKFYNRAGMALPDIEIIAGQAMPQPYKSLLVHERDMTSTLERFHGALCHVRALQYSEEEEYARLVVLELDGSRQPIEFGAIIIHLAAFSSHAQQLILARDHPLGTILHEEHIGFVSSPQAFFRVVSDELISEALQQKTGEVLFGRCNRLASPSGTALAEIVEILPV